MAWNWPWKAGSVAVPEKKSGMGFVALHAAGEAHWTRRDYAALAREGFMRNPVVHRSVRLISGDGVGDPLAALRGGGRTRRTSSARAAGAAEPAPGGSVFSRGALRAPAAVRQRLCRDDLGGWRQWGGRRAGTASLEARPGDGADRRGRLADRAGISRGKRQAQGDAWRLRRAQDEARARQRCICRCSIRSTTITVSRRWKPR